MVVEREIIPINFSADELADLLQESLDREAERSGLTVEQLMDRHHIRRDLVTWIRKEPKYWSNHGVVTHIAKTTGTKIEQWRSLLCEQIGGEEIRW